MRKLFTVFSLFLISCGHTVYIVRHAEKGTAMGNNSDVPLTPDGQQRALALGDSLRGKKIGYVFSTNTLRTRSTAKPVADEFSLPVQLYENPLTTGFIDSLRSLHSNILVVGHSNTVDDIANRVCGRTAIPGDLEDKEYDNLFVIKIKGKRTVFERRKYGKPVR